MTHCAGCRWDAAKRYERQLDKAFEQVDRVPVAALFGTRPEHTCGRPTFDMMLDQTIAALRTLRAMPPSDMRFRYARDHVRTLLAEMEIRI